MRKITMILTLTLISSTSLIAQSKAATDAPKHQDGRCMMVSDSMAHALGLTPDQLVRVQDSDARCRMACEKASKDAMGEKMDQTGMEKHDEELKVILTAEQYAQWSNACGKGHADAASPSGPGMK